MVEYHRTIPSEANLLICLSSFYHHKIIGKVLQIFRGDLLSQFFYLVLKWLKMEKIIEVVKESKGKKVGKGECWDVAAEALNKVKLNGMAIINLAKRWGVTVCALQ